MVTDPIADMLTRIRNALTARKDTVDILASNEKKAIAKILLEEGFIKDVELIDDNVQGTIRIALKYGPKNERVITGLKRISKPGLRVYAGVKDLPRVLKGLGIAVISTPKGIMTDKAARKNNVGGEVLAYIWLEVDYVQDRKKAYNHSRRRGPDHFGK
jgi:small subunit ribosomal protein S8